MTRKAVIIIILFLVLPSTGCWDRREINDLAIVTAVGYDLLPDNRILMTAQIAKPSTLRKSSIGSGGGGSGNNKADVMSAKLRNPLGGCAKD